MRILIVNGYSRKNQYKFKFFEETIIKFTQEQKELIDTDNEFHIRDKNTIEDYLYELVTSHVRTENAKNFDLIDIVFITGDSNLRPWSVFAHKMVSLLRMCMKVKKRVFASSFAFQALVFLSASSLDNNITVINGNEGGKLNEITDSKLQEQVKNNSFFLDNPTGDIYYYNYEQGEWIPKSNLGLHQRKAAQQFQSIGKYIIKSPVYKPKERLNENIISGNEVICQLKTTHIHDSYFYGMPYKFLVPMLNGWDAHYFAFTNKNKTFISLGESELGLQVIKYPSMLAVQFEIDKKYPFTLTIIQNFIITMMKEFKESKSFGQTASIMKRDSTNTLQSYGDTQEELKKNKKQVLMQVKKLNKKGFITTVEDESIYTKDIISRHLRHCGYSINKKHVSDIVNFNSVSEKRIKMSHVDSTYQALRHPTDIDTQEHDFTFKSSSFNKFSEREMITKVQFGVTSKSPAQFLPNFTGGPLKTNLINQTKIKMSSGQIRSFLHPSLTADCLDYKSLWVPGMSQTSKCQNSTQVKKSSINPNSMICRTFRSTLYSSTNSTRNINNHNTEFLNGENRYQSQSDMEKQYKKEEDKKILHGTRFILDNKKVTQDIPNYVLKKYIVPPKQIFRESVNKEKWISQNNFIA